METQQEELKIGLGKLENEKVMLKPAKVKIVNATIEATVKAKKVVFECKHPDKEETIRISTAAFIENKQVKISGTWFNMDKESKIQKGSALYVMLTKLNANSIEETIGKDVDTDLENNYLCFKLY
jgi:hypothetical protein